MGNEDRDGDEDMTTPCRGKNARRHWQDTDNMVNEDGAGKVTTWLELVTLRKSKKRWADSDWQVNDSSNN